MTPTRRKTRIVAWCWVFLVCVGIGATIVRAQVPGGMSLLDTTNVSITALLLARELLALIKVLVVKARIDEATAESFRLEIDRALNLILKQEEIQSGHIEALTLQETATLAALERANGLMADLTARIQVFLDERIALERSLQGVLHAVIRTDKYLSVWARTWGQSPDDVKQELLRITMNV